ncbi:MAG: extracellular solute-binding protein [Anaerolineae bacterium]|nr:extracellular solute-binding protein [Anaerolineae bacterium]
MFRRSRLPLPLVVVLVMVMVIGSGFHAKAADPVTVSITASGNELKWLTNTIKPAFEKKMTDAGTPVTVNLIDSGNISGDAQKQQLALDLKVGKGSDLFSFDGFWLPEFVDGGLLKSIDTLVGPDALNWEGWQQTPEGLKNILGYNGKLYGVPRGTDARVIWYNKDVLEKAGLPRDNWQPKSWAELLDVARAIKSKVPGVVPFQLNAGMAMGEATTLQGYMMALLGAGHHVYDFDQKKWIVSSPAILDTLNLYNTIYNTDGLGDSRWQLAKNGRDLSFKAFSEGKVGMLVEGDYLWRSILIPTGGSFPMANRDKAVGFALMPAKEPGKGFRGQDFVTISGGTGYVINPNSAHPKEAWALLTFMFSKDQLAELQKIEPRIRARLDVPVVGDETMSRMVKDVLPLTTIRPFLPAYNKVSEQIQLMTERIVSGEMAPQAAMDAYAKAVTEIVGADNTITLK